MFEYHYVLWRFFFFPNPVLEPRHHHHDIDLCQKLLGLSDTLKDFRYLHISPKLCVVPLPPDTLSLQYKK